MQELTGSERKKIQLDILKTVTGYCRELGLSCFLYHGTLLGAVRHRGYIPWDDDIDLAMPRPDFERLSRSFNRDNRGCRLLTHLQEPDFPYPLAKVSHNGSRLVENTAIQFAGLGVNIDIYIIDGLPDQKVRQKRLIRSIALYRRILDAKLIAVNPHRVFYKNGIITAGKLALAPVNYRSIVSKIDRKARAFTYDRGGWAASLTWGYGAREIAPRSCFQDRVLVQFEDSRYYAPAGYHEILTRLYGDYMQLPPAEKRVTHHSFTAYWR